MELVKFQCSFTSGEYFEVESTQEAHGPHLSPEKQFQLIHFLQSCYYTITLIKREKS